MVDARSDRVKSTRRSPTKRGTRRVQITRIWECARACRAPRAFRFPVLAVARGESVQVITRVVALPRGARTTAAAGGRLRAATSTGKNIHEESAFVRLRRDRVVARRLRLRRAESEHHSARSLVGTCRFEGGARSARRERRADARILARSGVLRRRARRHDLGARCDVQGELRSGRRDVLPVLRRDAPRNFPVELSLASARAGGAEIALAPATSRRATACAS
jgi:hypothetical protein